MRSGLNWRTPSVQGFLLEMSADQGVILNKVVGFMQKFLSVNQRRPLFGVSVNWRLDFMFRA